MTPDEPRAPEGAEPGESDSPTPPSANGPEAAAQSGTSAGVAVTGEKFDSTQVAETINNYHIDATGVAALLGGNSEGIAWASQLNVIRQEIQSLRGLFPSQPASASGSSSASASPPSGLDGMPATEQELHAWFGRLSAVERCQVRATAILHGAPAHIVTEAADELYAAVFPRARNDAKPQEASAPENLQLSGAIIERALTVVRKVGGAERLYWKDADSEGLSAFNIRALNLVAGEIAGTAGVRTENSRPVIERWVSSGRPEFSQRAAYALGVIWRKLDQRRLSDTVRGWARSVKESERQCAPLMALGAFASEYIEREAEARDGAAVATGGSASRVFGPPPAPGTSSETDAANGPHIQPYDTLQMLARMGSEAQGEARKGVDRGLFAIAVSSAYAIIGLDWIDHALNGLDRLLGLDPAYDHETPNMISGFVCLPAAVAYAQLASAGYMREALARLGAHVRRLARRPATKAFVSSSDRERETRRKDRLFNALLAFYFVIAASSPTSRRAWTRYGERVRLEESPTFERDDGRDVLLDGLLSADEAELQMDAQSLIWASMTGDTAGLAEQALNTWAERVAHAAVSAPGSPAAPAFEQFLLGLDTLSARRDTLSGYTGPEAPRRRFRRLLTKWSTVTTPDDKKRKVSAIARDVLAALPAL